MSTLVTGGVGFIGSHLCEALVEQGEYTIAVDDLSTSTIDNIEALEGRSNFECIIGSVMDEALMEDIIRRVDNIYHLAAAVGVRLIIDEPIKTLQTNVHGTEIIMKLAARYRKKVFLASSSEVYGKHEHAPLKEDDNRVFGSTERFRWSYACSKALDEFFAFAYYRKQALKVVIGRLFNIVGPRQQARYGMVLPRFIRQALAGEPITVYGDGKQTRTFLYVKDAVNAMLKLMQLDITSPVIYNIGSEEEITIQELAKKVKHILSSDSPIVYVPYDVAYGRDFEDMRRRVPDITKLKTDLNFKPTLNIDQIIEKTAEYIKQRATQI